MEQDGDSGTDRAEDGRGKMHIQSVVRRVGLMIPSPCVTGERGSSSGSRLAAACVTARPRPPLWVGQGVTENAPGLEGM